MQMFTTRVLRGASGGMIKLGVVRPDTQKFLTGAGRGGVIRLGVVRPTRHTEV